MDDEDFNSSDIDFGEPPVPRFDRLYGQASIDKMIANAQHDRIASKKSVKQLTLQSMAPSTEQNISLWVRRFDAFREHVLRKSTDQPFNGEDLIRFFDTIIGKIQLKDSNKPAPNLNSIQNAYAALIRYGTFLSPDFKISAHDGSRFQSFTIQAVKDGRLVTGTWRERTWIGFVTLSRLVRVFLEHSIRNGVQNFDMIISKCLSVVLISSLGCRSGDVVQSRGYISQEYMKYKDVELYFPVDAGDTPTFHQLMAIVTIKYAKGAKQTLNDDQIRYLRPLDAVQSAHVCPIALLLVHALRHGLVQGSTVEEVISHTVTQPDRHVKWTFPERPIVTSFSTNTQRCQLDTTAHSHQVNSTVKEMGLVAGMLSRTYGHSLRTGAIRDYAHLPNGGAKALRSTDDIRRFSGHTITAMNKGVTEKYVGGIAHDFYNYRAQDGGIHHRREPEFAIDNKELIGTRQMVSRHEMQAEIDKTLPEKSLDSLTPNERRVVQSRVKRQRVEALASAATREPKTSRTASRKELTSAPAMPQTKMDETQHRKSKPAQASPPPTTLLPSEEIGHLLTIDPSILDQESLASLQVSETELGILQAAVFGTAAEENETNADSEKGPTYEAMIQIQDEETARLMPGSDTANPEVRTASNPVEWINGYAKFNEVKNHNFATQWSKFIDGASFEDSIGQHAVRGNSRDDPTPYTFRCRETPGCTYQCLQSCELTLHEASCSEHFVAVRKAAEGKEALQCPHSDCTYETHSRGSLNHHIRGHKWIPKSYEDCPDDPRIYSTEPSFRTHKINVHSGRWPAKCSYPSCTSETNFGSQGALNSHLILKHGLSAPDSRLPYIPARPERKVWIATQTCPQPGCTHASPMKRPSYMLRHLKHTHMMSEEDAKDLIERKALYKKVVPKTVMGGSTGPIKRKRTDRTNHSTLKGDDKENVSPASSMDDV